MTKTDILIVGAGHGGAQAAIALRQAGFAGSITMIGDEEWAPYERPPLSKEYFAGQKPFERIMIRPERFWGERDIALHRGKRVVSMDASAHTATTEHGEVYAYGRMIWATGGAPRRLSCAGGDAEGVFVVRRRADVDAIKHALDRAQNVAVIGGGYIGLEAAAVLTKFGKHVTLLEALDRVLARVAGPELSRFYEAEHRAHGVDLHTGAAVSAIETENGAVKGVVLADGGRVAADIVIVGIGIIAETAPLIAAGAHGTNGVDVDAYCRTSLPDIYAIGDCAAHENRFAAGARIRLESVQNANDQAKTAVAAVMGERVPYDAVPWFWSNQYDLKLQTVGLSIGYDQAILRGDPASRSFSVLYLKHGALVAADCVNAMKEYVQARPHIVQGAKLKPEQLANAGIALKDIEALAP